MDLQEYQDQINNFTSGVNDLKEKFEQVKEGAESLGKGLESTSGLLLSSVMVSKELGLTKGFPSFSESLGKLRGKGKGNDDVDDEDLEPGEVLKQTTGISDEEADSFFNRPNFNESIPVDNDIESLGGDLLQQPMRLDNYFNNPSEIVGVDNTVDDLGGDLMDISNTTLSSERVGSSIIQNLSQPGITGSDSTLARALNGIQAGDDISNITNSVGDSIGSSVDAVSSTVGDAIEAGSESLLGVAGGLDASGVGSIAGGILTIGAILGTAVGGLVELFEPHKAPNLNDLAHVSYQAGV